MEDNTGVGVVILLAACIILRYVQGYYTEKINRPLFNNFLFFVINLECGWVINIIH